jgi:hypothetical protein
MKDRFVPGPSCSLDTKAPAAADIWQTGNRRAIARRAERPTRGWIRRSWREDSSRIALLALSSPRHGLHLPYSQNNAHTSDTERNLNRACQTTFPNFPRRRYLRMRATRKTRRVIDSLRNRAPDPGVYRDRPPPIHRASAANKCSRTMRQAIRQR